LKTGKRDFIFRTATMDKFIHHFRREGAGVWVCVSPGTLQLPEGRIQVAEGTRFTLGTMFMNVEIAAMLEAQYAKNQESQPRAA
jgi:hypothetical protein